MYRLTCVRLFVILVTFFLPFKSIAWNSLGHMVITQIAYEHLTPIAKQKVDNLVTYFAKEYPSTPTLLQMAIWPDAVRSQKIDTFTRWHYIDVPFSADGTPLADTISTDNAAWALNAVKSVVKNERANAYERARFLAFTLHIVADLHQPLHTVTRLTKMHPAGDRGGNLFYVATRRAKMNLHKLWDGGVGALTGNANPEDVIVIAQDLINRYPESAFASESSNFNVTDWEKEGMINARTYVYNTQENAPISTSYRNVGKQVAEQELALAGYRLANLLNALLEPSR